MTYRRNEYDVTDRVNTTDVGQVCAEVCRIYQDLYQSDGSAVLKQAFGDFERLYRGDEADYHACDTEHHDIQHVLDVTPAMADGGARATNAAVMSERPFGGGSRTWRTGATWDEISAAGTCTGKKRRRTCATEVIAAAKDPALLRRQPPAWNPVRSKE
jgi:hypothetical protein